MRVTIEEVSPDGLSMQFWRFTYNGEEIYLSGAGRCERKTTRQKWVECQDAYAAWSSRIPAPTVPRRVVDKARAEIAANIPTTIHGVDIDEEARP